MATPATASRLKTGTQKKRGGDRRAEFISSNLELLGFGNARDALIQTVKELLENALDAIITSSSSSGDSQTPFDAPSPEMLRLRVQWNPETQVVDVVCADTGTGMRAHEIRQLCCGVFETTKADSGSKRGVVSCGKYGLGLKAATLYSQQHIPMASLNIVTTSQSSEILYIELRLDPESDEPAVVQHVESFAVDEDHRQFSGTEMRISIPAPETTDDVEYAVDVLAVYVQSLRYTLPAFVGVDFALEIGDTSMEFDWNPGDEPIDRFASDFNTMVDDLVYATRSSKGFNINCMALYHSDDISELKSPCEIEITVLRYANHVPLVNADDFFLCSLTKGILCNRMWKKLGYQCRRNASHLVNQLVSAPTQSRRSPAATTAPPARLILAFDVSSDVDHDGASVRYANLKKTALDKSYLVDAQACCRSIIEQLHKRGQIVTPTQSRDEELLLDYAPLVTNAAMSILRRSSSILFASTSSCRGDVSMHSDELDAITASLQDLLSQGLSSDP